jgi:hypothetical protein
MREWLVGNTAVSVLGIIERLRECLRYGNVDICRLAEIDDTMFIFDRLKLFPSVST